MFQVGRETRQDKLVTLFEHYGELEEQVIWCYNLNYYKAEFLGLSYQISITSQKIDNIRKTARWLSYLICGLMLWLIMIEHDTQNKESYFTFFKWEQKYIVRFICLFQLALTLTFFGLWIKMRLNLCLSKLQSFWDEQGGG